MHAGYLSKNFVIVLELSNHKIVWETKVPQVLKV